MRGKSYNKKINFILIPVSVKKQLGSGSGFRFSAGSAFNEYGFETLVISFGSGKLIRTIMGPDQPHCRKGCTYMVSNKLKESSSDRQNENSA